MIHGIIIHSQKEVQPLLTPTSVLRTPSDTPIWEAKSPIWGAKSPIWGGHGGRIRQKELAIALLHEVESPNSEDDLVVVVIDVDDVQQRSALGLLVRDSLDEPIQVGSSATDGKELGVSEIGLVDSEDDA